MHSLLNSLGELPSGLVYAITALLVAAETGLMLGLVLPGEATLLLVGFLAYSGAIELVPAMILMVVAGIAGDALAFRSGRRYGPKLRASRLGRWVGEERWARADGMVNRLGGRAFFGGRWVAFVRTLAPRLAGSSQMRYRTFAPWAALGVLTWASASVLVGYLAGRSYERVSQVLGQATSAVLGLVALLVVIALVGRWLGRNPDPVRALVGRVGRVPAVGRAVRWLDEGFRALVARLGPGWTLALNLVLGIALLFGLGAALAALSSLLVRISGVSALDSSISRWIDRQSDPAVTHAAKTALSVTRGPVLITLVAVVAIVMGFRTRRWHGDRVTILGTAGAFLPLIVLTVIAREAAPDAGITASFLTTQAAVGTASICTLAWLFTRGLGLRWGWSVTVWTLAIGLIALLDAARLYVGFDTVSSLASAQLLGALWAVMFIVAWTVAGTRRDAGERPQPMSSLLGPPTVTGADAGRHARSAPDADTDAGAAHPPDGDAAPDADPRAPDGDDQASARQPVGRASRRGGR
jgi:membrane protein DedA with SNARE-associated domain